MSEPEETSGQAAGPTPLAAAKRAIKNAFADRDDVVVELREGQVTRLEMLADALEDVFAEVPSEDERFDFAISSGQQPRLWIDAVAHVTLARDRRTYRFLRDTRLGRTVLAETGDIGALKQRVIDYIAERLVERDRAIAGDPISFRPSVAGDVPDAVRERREGRSGRLLKGLGVLFLGALFGGALVLVLAWMRLSALGISF